MPKTHPNIQNRELFTSKSADLELCSTDKEIRHVIKGIKVTSSVWQQKIFSAGRVGFINCVGGLVILCMMNIGENNAAV